MSGNFPEKREEEFDSKKFGNVSGVSREVNFICILENL